MRFLLIILLFSGCAYKVDINRTGNTVDSVVMWGTKADVVLDNGTVIAINTRGGGLTLGFFRDILTSAVIYAKETVRWDVNGDEECTIKDDSGDDK